MGTHRIRDVQKPLKQLSTYLGIPWHQCNGNICQYVVAEFQDFWKIKPLIFIVKLDVLKKRTYAP